MKRWARRVGIVALWMLGLVGVIATEGAENVRSSASANLDDGQVADFAVGLFVDGTSRQGVMPSVQFPKPAEPFAFSSNVRCLGCDSLAHRLEVFNGDELVGSSNGTAVFFDPACDICEHHLTARITRLVEVDPFYLGETAFLSVEGSYDLSRIEVDLPIMSGSRPDEEFPESSDDDDDDDDDDGKDPPAP